MSNDTTTFSDNKYTAFPKLKRILRYLFANLTLEVQFYNSKTMAWFLHSGNTGLKWVKLRAHQWWL